MVASATLTAMEPEPPLPPKTRMDLLLERMAIHHNWVQPLVGRTCSRITIDRYSPLLVLTFMYDGPEARVEIDAPFRFADASGSRLLDPGGDRPASAPVLSLIERTVTLAVANEDGSLHLEFGGGVSIDVAQLDDIIEAWWFHMDDDDDGPAPEP
jgi:hypothetical protein